MLTACNFSEENPTSYLHIISRVLYVGPELISRVVCRWSHIQFSRVTLWTLLPPVAVAILAAYPHWHSDTRERKACIWCLLSYRYHRAAIGIAIVGSLMHIHLGHKFRCNHFKPFWHTTEIECTQCGISNSLRVPEENPTSWTGIN
jgi:hypothetical protein